MRNKALNHSLSVEKESFECRAVLPSPLYGEALVVRAHAPVDLLDLGFYCNYFFRFPASASVDVVDFFASSIAFFCCSICWSINFCGTYFFTS